MALWGSHRLNLLALHDTFQLHDSSMGKWRLSRTVLNQIAAVFTVCLLVTCVIAVSTGFKSKLLLQRHLLHRVEHVPQQWQHCKSWGQWHRRAHSNFINAHATLSETCLGQACCFSLQMVAVYLYFRHSRGHIEKLCQGMQHVMLYNSSNHACSAIL